VIPQNLGGAGIYRIDWELDDAVFKEAAGKDFMLEAIDVLKGVLDLEETPSNNAASDNRASYNGASFLHGRSKSQPLPSDQKPQSLTGVQPKRGRAPSDPFLDTPPVRSATLPAHEEENTPDLDESEEYLRIWTSPDLPNPEILELLKIFPAFISRRALPRFPAPSSRHPDLEEGEGGEGTRINFGTGSMWVSSKLRTDGWNGGWWSRFVLWWRRLFC